MLFGIDRSMIPQGKLQNSLERIEILNHAVDNDVTENAQKGCVQKKKWW